MIKLSKRLLEISNYIPDNISMVDIGCDHALLDIYLCNFRKNINITATDINKNALNIAKNNIKKNKLDKQIKTVLSDGLEKIETDNIDTIVISGMGAHTIVGILLNNIKKTKKVDNIIIQSNNDLDFLRKRVCEIGYYIDNESLVKDAGIIYTVISFKKGHIHYNKKELFFGPILMKENSKLFIEKKENDLATLKKFYPLIPKNHIYHKLITYLKIRMYK